MDIQDDIRFHSARAVAELDRALGRAGADAAKAHFDLSALHPRETRTLARSTSATMPRAH